MVTIILSKFTYTIAQVFCNEISTLFCFSCMQHTTVLVTDRKNVIDSEVIIPEKPNAPIIFKGVGMTADNDNPLVLEILTASSTAYSYYPDEKISEVIKLVWLCS